MSSKLEKLFEPIGIGSIHLKNRLVMSPMATNFADRNGRVTPRLITHYIERAKNDVGMVTIEATSVSNTGRATIHQLGAYKDDFIPGLTKLVEEIKKYDCMCVLQLHHAGRRAESNMNNGAIPVAPSPIPCVGKEIPRELTVHEIERIIEEFANAARRAKIAGFDAVELHGAHGYLIAQFLSPLSNKRTDNYGGTIENRTRFVTEIVNLIKEKVGINYPILMKISGDEYLPGGLTIDDTKAMVRIFQDGGVDAVIVSAGHTGAATEGYAKTVPGDYYPRGCYTNLAEEIKKIASIPVGAVGRINDPMLAENILRENKADLIYMGRALLADPELPMKAKLEKFEDIRTCIACNMCQKTLRPNSEETDLSCAVNAALGREEDYRLVPVQKSKKVLVIGGGPAGMESARVASLRGHKVFLHEKQGQVGGQLLLAAIPPHKDEILHFVRYLSSQIRKLGVIVEVNQEVKPETVERIKPDVVIMATGSLPWTPEISGVDGANVILAEDVLTGKARFKDGEIIILGGGIVGSQTAEFSAVAGRKVTIVEMLSEIAEGLEETARSQLRERLTQHHVAILTSATVQRITSKGVVLDSGRMIPADTVVLAAGRIADNKLIEPLRGFAPEIYVIGDCAKPRMIIDAIREGAAIGKAI